MSSRYAFGSPFTVQATIFIRFTWGYRGISSYLGLYLLIHRVHTAHAKMRSAVLRINYYNMALINTSKYVDLLKHKANYTQVE